MHLIRFPLFESNDMRISLCDGRNSPVRTRTTVLAAAPGINHFFIVSFAQLG
jgi:hypothetical protein